MYLLSLWQSVLKSCVVVLAAQHLTAVFITVARVQKKYAIFLQNLKWEFIILVKT